MDIGKAIKVLRKERGLSQDELGGLVGLSGNAISQIETGATFPHKENIKRICEALNIPVAYLMFFSISDEDLPAETKSIFNALQQPIKDVLLEDLKKI